MANTLIKCTKYNIKVPVKMQQEMVDALDKVAACDGSGRSAVIRRALEDYLQKHEKEHSDE